MAWVRENDIQFILELAKHFEAKLIYFGKTKDINKKGLVKWIQS